MMKYLLPVLNFLKGGAAKFGTTTNLLREVTLSVLTAVVVAISVQLLTPKDHDPITDLKDVLTTIRTNQHQADSVAAVIKLLVLQRKIDSLNTQIQKRDEEDSLRRNHYHSTLDAMRNINRAIKRAN